MSNCLARFERLTFEAAPALRRQSAWTVEASRNANFATRYLEIS